MPVLPETCIFDVLNSEHHVHGSTEHQLFSVQQLFEKNLPNIILENPEIVADSKNSMHVITIEHVQIDSPVSRTNGGFYDLINPQSAKTTRHTYASPIVVDVVHRIYSSTTSSKTVVWETLDPSRVEKEIQALESKQRGTPVAAAAVAPPPPIAVLAGDAVVDADAAAIAAAAAPKQKRRRKNILDALPAGTALPEDTWTLKEDRKFRQVVQFHMPVMVRGGRYDPGGYFIVKGSEKVVLTQKRLATNRFYVFPSTKSAWTWTGEIRACHSVKIRSTSTLRVNIHTGKRGSGVIWGVVEMPYIDAQIPVMAICRLLGFANADEVATSAATGGVLSGRIPIRKGCLWDVHSVHTTRQWILSLLKDDAHKFPGFETMTRSRILQWVGEEGTKRKSMGDRSKYVAHLMANEFLPQLGLDSSALTIARKAQMFAFMLWRLANVARENTEPDDRDHAGNKQYDTPGMLLALLMRQHYRNFRKKISSEIRRLSDGGRFVSLPDLMNIKRMTDGFTYALSTGNWGLQKGGSTQTGVAQMLSRMNMIATVSHLRRVNTPLKREGKQARPRHINTSSFGNMCPAETPEGPACGLVEQMAQCVVYCTGYAADKLIRRTAELLGDMLFPLVDASICEGKMALLPPRPSIRSAESYVSRVTILEHEPEEWEGVHALQEASDARLMHESTDIMRVIVNGVLLGFVTDGPGAVRALREGRRKSRLPFDVAIESIEALGVLCVNGEAGGIRRPLFRLDADSSLKRVEEAWKRFRSAPPDTLWRELVKIGAIEYVSKHEEETLMILESPQQGIATCHVALEHYTHCELHPSVMLGVAAAMIPFSDHNQAPRTTYFTSMSKQTAGNPGPDTPYTNALRLWYPQHSLVTTWATSIHNFDRVPSGLNAWVAVAADGGENQEDSLYMNSDSAARGLFACYVIRNHTEDCQTGSGADAQRFEKPPAHCFGRKVANYDKLNEHGVVPCGTHLKAGDVFIGKTMDVNEMGCVKRSTIRRDQSVMLNARDHATTVDSVTRCRGRDDKDMVTVQMHTVRFLKPGDKLTSEHGQKGVCGAQRRQVDMPFTADGISADLVINPHAFPSRMTIGQILSSALGLVCAKTGETGDGTPFRGVSSDDINRELRSNGFDDMGDTVMYQGKTGKPVKYKLYFGPTYYFRVKQMVDDKHHARARGPVHVLTQQPMEGRAKYGGLRIGEMERDCIQAHGASFATWDRLFQQSDYAEIPVCRQCHLIAMPRAPLAQQQVTFGLNETSGYCANCKMAGMVYNTPMPYVAKLLSHELMTMHIRPEIIIDVNPCVDVHAAASVGVFKLDKDADVLKTGVQKKRVRGSDMPRPSNGGVSAVPAGFSTTLPRDKWPRREASYMPATSASVGSPAYLPASPPYFPADAPYTPSSPLQYTPFASGSPTSPAFEPSSPPYTPFMSGSPVL